MSPVLHTLPALVPSATVPLAGGDLVAYANLDGAATTSALQSVADRVTGALPYYASVHRGAGWLSQVATTLYESSRARIGDFVGARTEDVTILTRNTTEALNLLASAVPAGTDGRPGRVLALDLEHHANLLPWRRSGALTVLAAASTVTGTLDAIATELAARPYALLTVSGASNVTGERLPLAVLVGLAHRHGARIAVDGAQLVPHRHFSLADSGVDYVAFSGHKAYAPFGAGALVGRRDWLDAAPPHLAGGGAVTQVTSVGHRWAASPARHEGGTPNLLGAVALAAAADALSEIGEADLLAHERHLLTRLESGLDALPGVTRLRIWNDSEDAVAVVSFVVGDRDAGLVAAYLAAEHGVGIRDGLFCAHPLLQRLGFPGGALRASIGIGTTAEDVDRLLDGLTEFLTTGPRQEYEVRDGCWALADDQRPIPDVTDAFALVPTAACGPGI